MRYVAQRLVQFILVFIIVTFTVMAVTRIGSTDPVREVAGGAVSEEQLQRVIEDYPYLDEPLPVQWVMWMKDILTGDWGYSYIASQSTIEMFQQRMPTTVFIVLWAIFIGLLIAVPLGVYSAYKRDSLFDRAASIGSFAVISAPAVVVAVIFLFPVVSRSVFFPSVGRSSYVAPWDNPVAHFQNFFIPASCSALGIGAIWSRLLRSEMILTLQSDSVNMARSKGISPSRVLWVHALRMSILTLITSVALQMSALIGGTVIIEAVLRPEGHRRAPCCSPSSRTTCSSSRGSWPSSSSPSCSPT